MFEKLKGRLAEEDIDSLHTLYVVELQDALDAELQIIDELPKMVKGVNHGSLKRALEDHRKETGVHIDRLRKIIHKSGKDESDERCLAMEGIIKETRVRLGMEGNEAVKDAALIAAAQRIEHYEISLYGTLVAYADLLGESEARQKLSETLREEKEADVKLTEIAMQEVNLEAPVV